MGFLGIGYHIESGTVDVLNILGDALAVKELHVGRQALAGLNRPAELHAPAQQRGGLIPQVVVEKHIAQQSRGPQMAPAPVPCILHVKGNVGHPLRDGAGSRNIGRAHIGHFQSRGHRPMFVESARIADHRIIDGRIAVRSLEIDRRGRGAQIAESREPASDRKARHLDIGHLQRKRIARAPEVGLNVADDRPDPSGIGDRLEIEGRGRRIELDLLTLLRRVGHRDVGRYEVEVVGDAVEIVRKPHVGIASYAENHLLVLACDDEARQARLTESPFDSRVIGLYDFRSHHRVDFDASPVDEYHFGTAVVFEYLSLQARESQRAQGRCRA